MSGNPSKKNPWDFGLRIAHLHVGSWPESECHVDVDNAGGTEKVCFAAAFLGGCFGLSARGCGLEPAFVDEKKRGFGRFKGASTC